MKKNTFKKPQISEVRDLTIKLAKANKEISEERNMRKEMVANISHDLRAPMTAIRNAIDYLGTFEGDEMPSVDEFHNIVSLLDRRSRNLENLIQDLFYLTSLDNPSHKYKFEKVNMYNFLMEYYYYLEDDKKYKTRKLELNLDDLGNKASMIDIESFTRTLDNLFTNAYKYSKEGATIGLKAYNDHNKIVIVVYDTGLGIPKADIPKIFNRSYTVSSARTPETVTGSGLGLAIVKTIVEHHKGRVRCESELGVGSKFFIELPLVN